VLIASRQQSLGLFDLGFLALFVLSGVGNDSIHKTIPAVFRSLGRTAVDSGTDPPSVEHEPRRMANAVIGIAGAIGAFGGVLVNIAFRKSFLANSSGDSAYVVLIAFYLFCLAPTWAVYLRPSASRLADV